MSVADIPSELVLINAEKRMAENSFDQIYQKYRDTVFNYLLYLADDHNRASDLYQDTMMKIFKKINDQNDPQKRKAWVYTIARNTYLDDQRKRKRWQRLQVWHHPDIEDLSDISDDTAEIPDRIMEERDLNDQLKQIVKKLPSDQREVIVMHYIWELPFREIAEIMNISINTVAARARYGLQKMRIAVGDQK